MTDPNNSRISVSEDKLRLLFAEFKLELVKELSSYATTAAVEKWKDEVARQISEIGGRLRKVEDAQTGSLAVSGTTKWVIGLAVLFISSVIGALLYMVAGGGIH